MKEKKISPSVLKLKKWLSDKNYKVYELAAAVGVSPESIYCILKGSKCPSHKTAEKLFEVTGIKFTSAATGGKRLNNGFASKYL